MSATQPATIPGCSRYRALKIIAKNSLLRPVYKTVVPRTIFLLYHGDSFMFPFNAFSSID